MITLFLVIVFLVLMSLNIIFVVKTVFKYKVNKKLLILIPMPFVLPLLFKGIVLFSGYNPSSEFRELWQRIAEASIFNLFLMICSFIITIHFRWLNKFSKTLNFDWMIILFNLFLICVFSNEQYSILFSNL